MEFRVASLSDTGRSRTNNEDSLLADLPLVAVADGMGGHSGGEVASGIAVDVLRSWKDRLDGTSGTEAATTLGQAFHDANRVVSERGEQDEELRGMGTTLTAAWISDDKIALAHVGDSRAYLLRGNTLQQLTEDQNVAQEWVRRGRLTEEEAASSPHRHIVLQAIGAETAGLDVDVASADVRPGDRIVLASDGLFGMLKTNDALRDILIANPDNDEACRALVDAANEAGGADNISVVIVELVGDVDATGSDEAVVIERSAPVGAAAATADASDDPPKAERSSRARSRLIAAGAVVLLAAMAVVLLVRPTGANYVVSTRGGVIVLLDGTVGDRNEPAEGRVIRRYPDAPLDSFPATTQRQLRQGYDVDTVEEADELIAGLPRQLGPKDTPTPEPSGSPAGSPADSPGPSPTAPDASP